MVELAAKVANTDVPDSTNAFMVFILTERFQNLIPEGNWSLPASLPKALWPETFTEQLLPKKVLFFFEKEAAVLRKETIEEWRRALSQ